MHPEFLKGCDITRFSSHFSHYFLSPFNAINFEKNPLPVSACDSAYPMRADVPLNLVHQPKLEILTSSQVDLDCFLVNFSFLNLSIGSDLFLLLLVIADHSVTVF